MMVAKDDGGRKWKYKFYTPAARRPEDLRQPHPALVGGGSKHSAEAKMQFWLTLRISCNCNTPSQSPLLALDTCLLSEVSGSALTGRQTPFSPASGRAMSSWVCGAAACLEPLSPNRAVGPGQAGGTRATRLVSDAAF